jgi:simple sugar transport system substrate-binding protein
MFAVDAGSTETVAKVIKKYKPARQGREGRRLRPHAEHAEAAGRGQIDFTIDQQPYLQGFPARAFMYRSQTLTASPTSTPA